MLRLRHQPSPPVPIHTLRLWLHGLTAILSTVISYNGAYRVLQAMSQTNTANTTYTITSLLPGTTYEVRIMSRCGTNFRYSPWSSITTPAMPGCGSAVISCGTSTTTSIGINWAAQTNAIGYRIRYQRVGFATSGNITVATGGLTSYNIPSAAKHDLQYLDPYPVRQWFLLSEQSIVYHLGHGFVDGS